jgi:hypothetical protein
MGSFISCKYNPNVSSVRLLEEAPLFKIGHFSSHVCKKHFIFILLSFHFTTNPRPGGVMPDDQLVSKTSI